jgi:ribosomal subunit interface protein
MTMAAQLQITVRDMAHSAVLDSRIRRKLAGLEKIHPRITAFHVTLEAPHHHHRKGGQFCVTLDIKMPGAEILVTRDHDQDIYVALRAACQVARRQLIEHAARGQGADKALRSRPQRVAAAEAPGSE